jgi:hypothetical protein
MIVKSVTDLRGLDGIPADGPVMAVAKGWRSTSPSRIRMRRNPTSVRLKEANPKL